MLKTLTAAAGVTAPRHHLTELERAKEIEMQASHDCLFEEMHRIYRDLRVGLCYLDTNYRFIHINDWLAQINGIPAEEHLGRTIGELMPDVAAGAEAQFRHVIDTGEPIIGGAVEAETPAQPGIKRYFELDYYPVWSDDGEVIGISCIVEDVTVRNEALATLRQVDDEFEQRVQEITAELQKINEILNQEISQRTRAEKAQQDSEEQFRKLIEGSIQGVVIHRDGKPLFANQAIADTFGYDSPEEIVALPSIRLLKAEHEQERLEAYSAARLKGRTRPERYDFEGVRKDGIPIWLENFVTVVDWEGEPAIQSTTIDVTERKRLGEELENRIGQLELAQAAFERQAEELVVMAETLTVARD